MCFGNRAQVSAHFINHELCALWENAQACANKHGTGLKPTHTEIEYGTCLYEFFGPGKHLHRDGSKDDLTFYARFGQPRLEFVCNHEVVLFLNIEEGHYSLDTNQSQNKTSHEQVDDYTLAYRLDFNIASIEGFACKTIGNADDYTLNLFILNFATAIFCPELSSVGGIAVRDSDTKLAPIDNYIRTSYFPLVKRAGHHVLYSLPDFDDLTSTTAHIDYSIISPGTLATRELHGITVDEINTYLRGLWLQVAAHIDEHGVDNPNVNKGYLVDHKSTWTHVTEDINFNIIFGPMAVQPPCRREVVLYLDLQDVYFFPGGTSFNQEPQHHFSNWKIAVVVDVTFEGDDTGNVRRLKLNFPSARYFEPLSTMDVPTDVNSDIILRMRTALIRYITTQYLRILNDAGDQQIYYHDRRIHVTTQKEPTPDVEDSEDDGCYCDGDCTCGPEVNGPRNGVLVTPPTGEKKWERIQWGDIEKARVRHTTTLAYDQITAVTQGTINDHFRSIWEVSRRRTYELSPDVSSNVEHLFDTCLSQYVYFTGTGRDRVVYFEGSFRAPQLQLLPSKANERIVILYFHVIDGKMRTLNHRNTLAKDGEVIPFGNWRIAFEVPLKLEDCSDERPAPVDLMKRLKRTSHRTFKQLFLDIPKAKFCIARSSLPGLLHAKNPRLIRDKHNAVIHYLTAYYLPTFVNAGHDVLYTISMYDGTPDSVFPLTSINFYVVPFVVGPSRSWVEGLFGPQRPLFDRNQIVFTGMINNRPYPVGPSAIPTGGSYVAGGMTGGKNAVQHGTVVISRRVFLEDKILGLFNRINRETTILPSFSGIQPSGEWLLKLTAWEKHEAKRGVECRWKQLPNTNNALEFEWRNREEWRYEHEGDEGNNGWYNVTCNTRNTLSVPVVHLHTGSLAIIIQGLVDLKLAYSGASQSWDSGMQAQWAVSINFVSDPRQGVRIHTSPASIVPEFRGQHEHGTLGHSSFTQAFQDLKNQLPMAFDFNRVVDDLHVALNSAQTQFYVKSRDQILVNPTFNFKGDLMVELQVRLDVPAVRPDPAARADTSDLDFILESRTGASTPNSRMSWISQAKSKLGESFQTHSRSVSLALSTSAMSATSDTSVSPRKSYAYSPPRNGYAYSQNGRSSYAPAGENISLSQNGSHPTRG